MTNKISPFLACRSCTCSGLRRASRAVTQHYENSFRGTGLRATQFTILATLAQSGPQALSMLANMLGLERTTLTRNLGPLEKRGLVSTVADADQRIRRIAITPEGEAAALAALDAWKRAQDSVDEIIRRTGIQNLIGSGCG